MEMRQRVFGLTLLMVGLWSGVNVAQTLKPRPPRGTQQNEEAPGTQTEPNKVDASPVMMPMNVDVGTPIKVAIDSEVRIRAVGQIIHGKTTEPVYAFDKLLILWDVQTGQKIRTFKGHGHVVNSDKSVTISGPITAVLSPMVPRVLPPAACSA